MIDCSHLAGLPRPEPAPLSATCEGCAADGGHPVQLRLCLVCGHVGCCDSSAGRHATAHFEETGHAVMRSFEPGQNWRWCYVDAHLV
ncbi:UBP-type zinc finger domain-containing protein [Streptomyces orinoci]|uniref:UBP-type zinc finger domain-containing protein n=1 Tax=Streptomyces orinoci TaxID=67339 RepID=A0ABV3JT23_STRON|nr:UBP-type zinc finger domain-containing protein [Streptomyces orinoci]